MPDCIKKYKEIIILGMMVLGFGWWLYSIDATASSAKRKTETLDATQKMLAASVIASEAKMEVYLTLYGFDDEIAREWARMPRECPADSTGAPIRWVPWLEAAEDLTVGIRYMVDDSLDVLVDTLWDFREPKK